MTENVTLQEEKPNNAAILKKYNEIALFKNSKFSPRGRKTPYCIMNMSLYFFSLVYQKDDNKATIICCYYYYYSRTTVLNLVSTENMNSIIKFRT